MISSHGMPLAISPVQIEPAGQDAPGDRAFPDRRTDDFASPRDFKWKATLTDRSFGIGSSNASDADFRINGRKQSDLSLPQTGRHRTLKSRYEFPLMRSSANSGRPVFALRPWTAPVFSGLHVHLLPAMKPGTPVVTT
jgi:hypothetical protein